MAAGGGVWSTAEVAVALAGAPAGVETAVVSDDGLPVSAGAAPPELESVAEVDGAALVELVASVGWAGGAEPLVSVPELGSEGAVAVEDEDGEPVDVVEPVASDGGVVDAAGVPPGGLVADGLVVVGAGVPEAVEDGACCPPPGGSALTGAVSPPVAPGPGLVVGVELPAPEVVGVLEEDDGAPGGVEVTAPGGVEVTVPGGCVGVTTGRATGRARGAGCTRTEARSVSRVVGGAAAR